MISISISMLNVETNTCSLRIPINVALPVLYESERVIAINSKPHGIPHHDDADSKTPGILTVFRHLQSLDAAQSANAIDYKGRVYGVHRLDRVTSGILLLAKDKETAGMLTRKFRQKDVTKYYFAISSKKPKKQKQGWVKGDMAKGRRGAWMLEKSMKDPAITRFFTAGLGTLADDVVEEWKQLGDRHRRTNAKDGHSVSTAHWTNSSATSGGKVDWIAHFDGSVLWRWYCGGIIIVVIVVQNAAEQGCSANIFACVGTAREPWR